MVTGSTGLSKEEGACQTRILTAGVARDYLGAQ